MSADFLNSLVDAIFSAKKGKKGDKGMRGGKGKMMRASSSTNPKKKRKAKMKKRDKYNKPVDRFACDPNSTAGKLKRQRNLRQRRLDQINKEMGGGM